MTGDDFTPTPGTPPDDHRWRDAFVIVGVLVAGWVAICWLGVAVFRAVT